MLIDVGKVQTILHQIDSVVNSIIHYSKDTNKNNIIVFVLFITTNDITIINYNRIYYNKNQVIFFVLFNIIRDITIKNQVIFFVLFIIIRYITIKKSGHFLCFIQFNKRYYNKKSGHFLCNMHRVTSS